MTSWHHFFSTVTQNCQKLSQTCQCNVVRVHQYAYISYWRCKHTISRSNMDVGSNVQWSTASTMISWHHFHYTVTKNCSKPTKPLQCNGVRVHLYTYVPHWKVLKHFIYGQHGCEKQSAVVYSLNHDIMASFPLNNHPELPTSAPALSV